MLVEEWGQRLDKDMLPAADTLRIIALSSLLLVVMRRRMQREQQRQREARASGGTLADGEGEGTAQPRDGHLHQD